VLLARWNKRVAATAHGSPRPIRGGVTPKRALIVIDVQNEYFDGGALPITDPPPTQSLVNIGRAMDKAAERGVPTVVVRHTEQDPDAGMFREGSDGWLLRREVDERPRNHLVEKSLPGSFTDTTLADILASNGIDTVSIVGYMTHMCVDTTARQAAHRGLSVEILSDATGTLALENSGGGATGEELHRSTLVAQGQFFADIVSTDEWLSRLGE
jgi:nicotinamidase-related amidase